MYPTYAGCYIGISSMGIPVVFDLHSDGKFIVSGISKGEAVPFGLGEYTADGDVFTIPAKKARIMAILNNKEAKGEIRARKCLRLDGSIMYYAEDLKRTVFPFTVDDGRSPLPEHYAHSALDSFTRFDLTKHDFGNLSVEKAIEMAGMVPKNVPEEDPNEEKDFVPTREDTLKLYYKGQKIEGAYFDKKGNICYSEVKPRVFVSQDEASKTGDWSNVSWNIEADTEKERVRVDTINRANQARANGTFDENKDYSKEE